MFNYIIDVYVVASLIGLEALVGALCVETLRDV